VFFTTDNNECILNDLNDKIFDLKFNSNRSKFSNTLLVAEANITLKYNSSKYYSCVYFEKKSNNDSSSNMKEKNSLSKKFVHQGDKNVWTQIITTRELLPFYVVIIFYFFLLLFSALFSGLNLGLMSLDLTELQHLKHIGSAKEKSYALKIYPLRKKGNLLLCTILIGNVLVNSLSTLILGNYLEGVLAAAGSTLLIVIFGEIIPQAACSRHGLAVGAYTRHFTYIMMGLTYVISYPLSLILDVLLGKEIAAVYSREKARELILRATNDKQNGGMKENQYKLISGALDFKNKTVRETMVEIKDVFSLDINATLDFDTFKIILYHGYSRIPVYEFTR
jgi:metal transporter CNNM